MSFFRLRRKKKNKDKSHDDIMSSLAVKPASLNVSLLMDSAKRTMINYLLAFYSLNEEILPMSAMEEHFYYDTVSKMDTQLSAGITTQVNQVDIPSFNMEDYDNGVMYAVKSITYSMTFLVSGIINDVNGHNLLQINRKANVTFINDSRAGWLLSQFDDNGPV